jgi:hypothetical protein
MRFTRFLAVGIALSLGFGAIAQMRPSQLPPGVEAQLFKAGFHPSDLGDLVLKDDYRTDHNGLRHMYVRQRWQGIEIWNGDIALHTAPDGRLVKLNVGAHMALEKRVNATVPQVSAAAAVASVLAKDLPRLSMPDLLGAAEEGRMYTFDGSATSGEPIVAQLVYQPVGESLRLAWNVSHYTPDGSHWWNVRVDAITGEELERNDWVSSCAWDDHDHAVHAAAPAPALPASPNDYNVFDRPTESPSHGPRTQSNAPWLLGGIASPYGWHDTNGAAGAEFTDTQGNNCRAQEDADNNNTGGYRPSGGATLDFDFPIDLTGAPSTYLDPAITNLFYWNNLMHDVWYQYGFNEAAGNFQQNNYGRGGTGNDWVNADAQDGSGTNNANFSTPPDGSPGRMQMYRWTYTTPNRDSDLDNGVIAHEYGHGISTRLVGGPSNSSCLGNAEQMGEGWSDYFCLMMTMKAGDTGPMPRGVGTYLLGQPTTGGGIRPAPYSTSTSLNNYTYAATNNTTNISQPHGIGFVWCTMLWEMTWELINVYGFDPDVYNGTGGNNIAMRLVIDGLKLTPCSPGFVQARDAILAADLATYGGANQNYIWAAFARRGLGFSANQGLSTSRTDQAEAFDTPLNNNLGIAQVVSPSGVLLNCAVIDSPVTVTVRNYGQLAQSNFEVRYQVDGGAEVSEVFTGSIGAGASAAFTFTQPVTINGIGAHTLTARTALATDQFAGNDATSTSITISTSTTVSSTYIQDIESTTVAPAGWSLENPDGGNTWVTAALTGQAACVGTRAWAINHFDFNNPGQEDRLVSPVVDLGGSASSRLKFYYAYSGYSASYPDGFRVDASSDCGRTWNTLWQASGAALQTTAYATAAFTPTACSQWLLRDIDLAAYDGQQVLFRFVAINNYGNWFYLDKVVVERNGVQVALKLMLGGAFDAASDRMRDDLRAAGLVPTAEPYSAAGFPQIGGGGETIAGAVLGAAGDDAVVDWVHVQLRDAAAPSTIIAVRNALVQRDGDVVDKDGLSPVTFMAGNGSYYVAAMHRNHLGAMTASPVALNTTPAIVDLAAAAAPTYGTGGQQIANGRSMLWPGDVLRDGTLRYTGEGNDRDPILQAVGGSVPTNVSAPGYQAADVNLDGVVRYTGEGNDRDPILQAVGGSVPTNTRVQQLP